MYHSITFGVKNTWTDWRLVPESRPVFQPPSPKFKFIDIPGGNGVLDFTEALTGYPVYENRTGSFEFIVLNDFYEPVDAYEEWHETYRKIMSYLHGKKMKASLEDDPNHYYEGRFRVNEWKSGKNFSTIVIDYNVYPFAMDIYNSIRDVVFNPFEIGIPGSLWDSNSKALFDSTNDYMLDSTSIGTNRLKNIAVTTTAKTLTITKDEFGDAPISPTFVVSTTSGNGITCTATINGSTVTKTIGDGTSYITDYVFKGDTSITLSIKTASGTGTVSVIFQPGRL